MSEQAKKLVADAWGYVSIFKTRKVAAARIAELERMLAEREHIINERNQVIAEMAARITELEHEVTTK